MGIMDMFNRVVGNQPAPAAKPIEGNMAATTATNSATTASDGTAANGVVPTTSADAMKSPLDEFSTLWETDPDAKPEVSMFAGVDPKKIMESAEKVDFSKAVTPELAARIKAGGDDGFMASMEAMNKMNQLTYAQSAMATTKIVEQALANAADKFNTDLPGKIKNQQISDNMRAENPALSHPAAQPLLQAVEIQMNSKYPNATASEITALAKNYLTQFAAIVNPAKEAEPTKTPKSEDWDAFLM